MTLRLRGCIVLSMSPAPASRNRLAPADTSLGPGADSRHNGRVAGEGAREAGEGRDTYRSQRAEIRRLRGALSLLSEIAAVNAADLSVAEVRATNAERMGRAMRDRERLLEARLADLYRRLRWDRARQFRHGQEMAKRT